MVKNRLHILLAEKYINVSEFCRITGINRGSMFPIYHNIAKSITYEQIGKICKALKITPAELFEYTEE